MPPLSTKIETSHLDIRPSGVAESLKNAIQRPD
jgi:hypothetical protein